MEERSIPARFFDQAQSHPGKVLFQVKEGEAWRDVTWDEVRQAAAEIANGFLALGLGPGDRVALLAENRLEWIYVDLGILAAGGVTVTIYPSNLASEVEYIVANSGSRMIAVSTRAQYRKLAERSRTMPGLEKAVTLETLEEALADTLSLAALRELGQKHAVASPEALNQRVASIRPGDLATMVYTSGTTGPPKGAMLSHGNILAIYRAMDQILELDPETDKTLSILPYAHVYERIGGIFNGIFSGITIAICEGLDKIAANVAEVRPTMILGAPRLYEKMYSAIHKNVEAQPPLRQRIFRWALGVGRQASPYKLAGRPLPPWLRLKNRVADLLVFRTFKQRFGGRIRFFVSAAAPIAKEIIEFFHALDILIIEGWGMTETSAPSTINRPGEIKFGSVGRVIPGCEVKIAEDGEILVHGDNLFLGYFAQDGPIRDGFLADGWFQTGDIGRMDDDGYLYITDRKKDLIITAGGKNIAPQNLENLLKTDRYISEVLVFGDRKKFLAAIITLDEEAVTEWARRVGLTASTFAELCRHPETHRFIETRIAEINQQLPKHETIKRFHVLDRQFQQELGEITPTMKLKRKALYQKFGDVFEEMYEGLEDGDF